MMKTETSSLKFNRRQFLRRTGAGAALFYITPRNLLNAAPRVSANDKVNVAGIGVGSQGGSDINSVAAEGHNIVALCDVDSKYASKTFGKYPDAQQFKDYRVMRDKRGKETDGVVIGTPDPTQAIIALEAMRPGQRGYCATPTAL